MDWLDALPVLTVHSVQWKHLYTRISCYNVDIPSSLCGVVVLKGITCLTLSQVQELTSLSRRARHMGTSDLLPAEAAAIAFLRPKLTLCSHMLTMLVEQFNAPDW